MEKGLGLPECDTIEETCQLWLDDLDAKGVEKAVFVTAGGLAQSNENMALFSLRRTVLSDTHIITLLPRMQRKN